MGSCQESPCVFGLKLCKAELAQSLPWGSSRGVILPPSFAPSLSLPCRDTPALTTHSITPPGRALAAHEAAGDALGNEGVPVLLVGAVVHGILPHTCPIHGCRTEAQVGTGWPPRGCSAATSSHSRAGTPCREIPAVPQPPLAPGLGKSTRPNLLFKLCVCPVPVPGDTQGAHPGLEVPRGSGHPCACQWEHKHWGPVLSLQAFLKIPETRPCVSFLTSLLGVLVS